MLRGSQLNNRLRYIGMDKLGDLISGQRWLEPVEAALAAVANTILDKAIPFGQSLRNFLHGTWLGHPLHPAIN